MLSPSFAFIRCNCINFQLRVALSYSFLIEKQCKQIILFYDIFRICQISHKVIVNKKNKGSDR